MKVPKYPSSETSGAISVNTVASLGPRKPLLPLISILTTRRKWKKQDLKQITLQRVQIRILVRNVVLVSRNLPTYCSTCKAIRLRKVIYDTKNHKFMDAIV